MYLESAATPPTVVGGLCLGAWVQWEDRTWGAVGGPCLGCGGMTVPGVWWEDCTWGVMRGLYLGCGGRTVSRVCCQYQLLFLPQNLPFSAWWNCLCY